MTDEIEFTYDVFISYSSKDKDWVRGDLLKRLQAAGLRVCIDYQDFRPGAPSVKEMERAVLTSRKTLLILTPAYLNSAWTEFEALMLQTLDPANQNLRLIPLLKEKCDLPLRINYLNYIDFAQPDDLDFAWSRLLAALGTEQEAPSASPAKAKSAPMMPDVRDLQKKLVDRCDLGDLKNLCFTMGIDYDNYPATKSEFILELLRDVKKWGRVDEFVTTLNKEAPWVLR